MELSRKSLVNIALGVMMIWNGVGERAIATSNRTPPATTFSPTDAIGSESALQRHHPQVDPLSHVAQAPAGICPNQLAERINTITTRSEFARARWGILVQSLTGSTPLSSPITLYEQSAHQYFIPASSVKLLTTAAALDQLGPTFRTHTTIYAESAAELALANAAEPSQSTTPGPTVLRLVGQGDPSVTTETVMALAQQVRDRNIRHIDQLIIDDTYFQGSPINPTWEWEDVQSGYGAPVNSLILNQNEIVVHLYPQAVGQPLRLEWRNPIEQAGWQVVNRSTTIDASAPEWIRVGRDLSRPILYIDGQLRVGSTRDVSAVSIPNPTQHFAEQLRQALRQTGVTVAAMVMAEDALAEKREDGNNIERIRFDENRPEDSSLIIARHSSPLLPEWLQLANQNSNNLVAESLLRQLGAQSRAAQGQSTLSAGRTQLTSTLNALGIRADGYALNDGAGLSRRNLVSPVALVQTLQAMATHPLSAMYRDSLAIAATTGTLRYRFQNTPVAGRLYGKSGGLTGVAALSGYLYPPNYPTIVFSIIVNHSTQSGRINRQAIDEVVMQLAQLRECPASHFNE